MFNTKSIKQLKWENRKRHWRVIAASLTQLLNLFKRIDASSSVVLAVGLIGFTSIYV